MAKIMGNSLTKVSEKHNMKQNVSKATCIARLYGPGSYQTYHQLKSSGIGLCQQARYLGPQLHWRSIATKE
eukprot:4948301-Karenia_brevis.AAC.1